MQELTTENYYVTNYLGTIIPSNLFKKYIIRNVAIIAIINIIIISMIIFFLFI